jgi:hypothetical protein
MELTEFLYTVLLYALVAFVCAEVIYFVLYKFLIWKLRKLIPDISESVEQETEIPVSVEQHGDQFYFWHNITKEFICQGRNQEELTAAFLIKCTRYQNTKFLVVDGPEETLKNFQENLH